jgi:probable F420-dependent oxidoreductase
MDFAIAFANTMTFAGRDGLVDLARAAEDTGFESLWTVEHVVVPEEYESQYPYARGGKMQGDSSFPVPDPLIWLAFVAAETTTLRLATGILILPERNPLVTAKAAATLDSLSGGRLELGIGVGWLEEEFDALGVPFERRGARTDDYIAAMRALWASDDASHDGEFASFSGMTSNPKPAQGSVPVHVGGHTRRAAQRAGELGDGFFPAKGDLAELIDVVRQTAADHGRDPEAIEITAGSPGVLSPDDPLAAVQELADLGVDRVVVPAFIFLGDTAETMADFSSRVIEPSADL